MFRIRASSCKFHAMIPILTSAEMREADRRAINELGIPGMVLMENAARGACDVLAEMLGGLAGKRVLIVCGKGNNGGDGFAMARIALNAGAHARCMMLAAPDDLSGDAAAQYRILAAYAPGTIMPWGPRAARPGRCGGRSAPRGGAHPGSDRLRRGTGRPGRGRRRAAAPPA